MVLKTHLGKTDVKLLFNLQSVDKCGWRLS